MSHVGEYRRNAAECFCLAQETSSTETKELLLYMAQEWRRLSDKADVRSLISTKRIDCARRIDRETRTEFISRNGHRGGP
jgi:hypothetical protein